MTDTTYYVEEIGQTSYRSFLTWHFTCPSCQIRYRLNSGQSDFQCPRCQRTYSVKTDGSVTLPTERSIVQATGSDQVIRHTTPKKNLSRGVFYSLAAIVTEANDAAHAKRLRDGLVSTGEHLKKMDADLLALTMDSYLERCNQLEHSSRNWSRDGKLKIAHELQRKARTEFDFNQAESFSLWLCGAWLESVCRRSHDAIFVRTTLDHLRSLS